jgi:hypothetical protein
MSAIQNLDKYGMFDLVQCLMCWQGCCSSTLALLATSSDPFADEGDDSLGDVGSHQNYIHIRVQQRNGRKTLTTLQGLPKGEVFVLTEAPFPIRASLNCFFTRIRP